MVPFLLFLQTDNKMLGSVEAAAMVRRLPAAILSSNKRRATKAGLDGQRNSMVENRTQDGIRTWERGQAIDKRRACARELRAYPLSGVSFCSAQPIPVPAPAPAPVPDVWRAGGSARHGMHGREGGMDGRGAPVCLDRCG